MFLLKKKIQSQKGQILVLSVMLLPLILIMTIFIVEVGFFYIKQTQLQSAADAIALAKINTEDEALKLIKLNRTVAFNENNITTPQLETNSVVLQEKVIPIFSKLFGGDEITKIKVKADF